MNFFMNCIHYNSKTQFKQRFEEPVNHSDGRERSGEDSVSQVHHEVFRICGRNQHQREQCGTEGSRQQPYYGGCFFFNKNMI